MATKSTPKVVPAKKDAAQQLQDLFEDGLKDLYWSEKALYIKALPLMHKNATNAKLKAAIEKHRSQTKVHVERLEKCFGALDKKPQAKKCDAMQGIMDEGKSILEETEPGEIRDVAIIYASQKVEHYEITSYGSLAAFAKVLGHKECLKQLLATLKEEKKCDEDLTKMADTAMNTAAI